MEVLVGTVCVLVVAGMLCLGYWSHLQAKKRREELQGWARERGLAFSEDRRYGLDDDYPEFSVLRRGLNRYAYNISHGLWGNRRVLAFDYHYETKSTDSKGNTTTHHHYLSVAILDAAIPLKQLEIRPEHIFDRVAEFLGFDDIDFESDEFSRAFHVKSEDRRFAFDVIDQRMMEYLLESPRQPIWFSRQFLCTSTSRCWKPAEYDQSIRLLEGFLDRLSPSLVRELEEKM